MANAYIGWDELLHSARPPFFDMRCYCCRDQAEEKTNIDNGFVKASLTQKIVVQSRRVKGTDEVVRNAFPSVQPWLDRTEFADARTLLRQHSPLLFEIAHPKDFFESELFTRQNAAIVEIVAPAMLFLRFYLSPTKKGVHHEHGDVNTFKNTFVHFQNLMKNLKRMVRKGHSQTISDMKGTINKEEQCVTSCGTYHHYLAYCYDTAKHTKKEYKELLAKWTPAPKGRKKDKEVTTQHEIKWVARTRETGKMPTDQIREGCFVLIKAISSVVTKFFREFHNETLLLKSNTQTNLRKALREVITNAFLTEDGQLSKKDRMIGKSL